MLADILASQGHRVVTAGSGQKALRLIEGERFDVILSDVRMPELDGPSLYATLERSEEHTSELQSLMRSSYAVFCLKKKNKRKITRQRIRISRSSRSQEPDST